jgi:hypothetical protein
LHPSSAPKLPLWRNPGENETANHRPSILLTPSCDSWNANLRRHLRTVSTQLVCSTPDEDNCKIMCAPLWIRPTYESQGRDSPFFSAVDVKRAWQSKGYKVLRVVRVACCPASVTENRGSSSTPQPSSVLRRGQRLSKNGHICIRVTLAYPGFDDEAAERACMPRPSTYTTPFGSIRIHFKVVARSSAVGRKQFRLSIGKRTEQNGACRGGIPVGSR